jgi:transposase
MKTEKPAKNRETSTILVVVLVISILLVLIPFPMIMLDILMVANLSLAVLMLLAAIFSGKQRQRRIFPLIYLPGYSPNLNLIERYWGFLKKRILLNHYYQTFEAFREEILQFSQNKSKRLKYLLQRYIPETFHLIKPVYA